MINRPRKRALLADDQERIITKRLLHAAALSALLRALAYAQSSRVLLEEPFDDSFGSFPEIANDQANTSYLSDGSYGITLIARNYSYAVAPGGVPDAKDVFLEVNASQSTQVFDSLYGLACRIQPDGSHYMLAVSNLGLTPIIARIDAKPDGHHVEALSQGPLPEDGFIGNERLRVDCQGDKLTLYVNDKVMPEAQDSVIDTAKATTDYLPEPPAIPAAQDDTVTGSWVGRAVNEGLAAEVVWLNLKQVGIRVNGDAYVYLNGAPGYVKIGDIVGGFDPSGELKANITVDLDPGRSGGDPDAIGALELEQR